MAKKEVNLFPIQLLVNYWEWRPSNISKKLDAIMASGVSQIASFVPWQAIESDISHTFTRFLHAALDRKLFVSLIVTPEVGVHFPHSGIPKDLLNKKEVLAQSFSRNIIPVNLAPNSIALPSLFSPEFLKRYYSFLGKLDSLLFDLEKIHFDRLGNISILLSGSFWKYYRAPKDTTQNFLGGLGGDFSGYAAIDFRRRLEQFFSQMEFLEAGPRPLNRWKTKNLENMNRKWFYQEAEWVFRNRSRQMLRKLPTAMGVYEIELYTPEADPGFFYSNFIKMVTQKSADFYRLSGLSGEMMSMASANMDGVRMPPFLHWSSLGGFGSLSDSEKQFLLIKSVLLGGGLGGGILLDDDVWFGFSTKFRSKAEAFAHAIVQGDLKSVTQAFYVVPHLWSQPELSHTEFLQISAGTGKITASIPHAIFETQSKLIVVDPSYLLTYETLMKLLGWAKMGHTLALPRHHMFSEKARKELEKILRVDCGLQLHHGFTYQLFPLEPGNLVLFEVSQASGASSSDVSSWKTFYQSLLAISGIAASFELMGDGLSQIILRNKDKSEGLFLINGTKNSIHAKLEFKHPVQVSDLAALLTSLPIEIGSGLLPDCYYQIEVPPFGVLPLSIEKMEKSTQIEKKSSKLEVWI